MNKKRIGDLEVTTFEDSEAVHIGIWRNESFTEQIRLRSNEDLADLHYAIECIRNEQSRRASQRRGEGR